VHFLDNVRELRDRRDMVLASAVAAGTITAIQAWPEYFGEDQGDPGAFPSTGADMSGFQLEEATPASFEDDMEALVAASERVTIRDQPAPEPPDFARPLPDAEWP
jgi:hypothetical protein